jgi:four helix bundle suffix protein
MRRSLSGKLLTLVMAIRSGVTITCRDGNSALFRSQNKRTLYTYPENSDELIHCLYYCTTGTSAFIMKVSYLMYNQIKLPEATFIQQIGLRERMKTVRQQERNKSK